jgi:hypothetical protein
MATLGTILTTDVGIATAIETKFPFLPKLSTQLTTIAGKLPVGPDLPGVAVTVLEPPPPNKTGQPLASFFTSAPFTGPTGLPAGGGAQRVIPIQDRSPGVNFLQRHSQVRSDGQIINYK